MNYKNIDLRAYQYSLPEDRIAKYPLSDRSKSKLLTYDGDISHHEFNELPSLLPARATLFFNDTKVIPARVHFKKDTGALIEIFLLEPIAPTTDIAQAMLVKNKATWKCMVGNFKKWKNNIPLKTMLEFEGKPVTLTATIADSYDKHITFHWEGDQSFAEIIEAAGKIPLPPYINRELNSDDKERYQTVYSQHRGAVAAPTAGLHFTDQLLARLKEQGFRLDYLTLHVSAGTFQPIKAKNAIEHPMHSEQVVVSKSNIDHILQSEKVVAVGTTSMRTLESLYWYGIKLLEGKSDIFQIPKLYPYQFESKDLPGKREAFEAVKNHMHKSGADTINGHTEIFIFPGYQFKVCDGLITNYHLPGSTLILLVAAFIGEDWSKVYQEALDSGYRFLSYGDSSLLLPVK
ncbi:MAG: S-adenosylmethionine:tRNA ribosyltransferase-isomerase [Fulvivirga sp.]|nr:S-adenosylmethionine:tRNA ribosyltransferase-isomerase [Fulvivirga sp.]